MVKLNIRRLNRKKLVTLAVVLPLILVVLIVRSLTGPAKGTIMNPQRNDRGQQQATYATLNGQNFELSYPEKYQLENTGKHAVNILESYRLTASGGRGGLARLIAITIYDVPGGMQEASAYKTRIKNAAKYQQRIEKINGYEIRFFDNTELPETVAFIQKGNKVATVAYSGGIEADGAHAEYSRVIESYNWK